MHPKPGHAKLTQRVINKTRQDNKQNKFQIMNQKEQFTPIHISIYYIFVPSFCTMQMLLSRYIQNYLHEYLHEKN